MTSAPSRTDGSGALDAALQELAGLLLSTDSFHDVMEQIADLATHLVAGAVTCGITIANAGRIITVASSNQLGSLLDEQQYDLDEGPCLEALRTGEVVSAPDLATETRWGGYPQIAMAHGVSAILSNPLAVRGETVGCSTCTPTGQRRSTATPSRS